METSLNSSDNPVHHADLIVVGGGVAGLTAAALVARAGKSVIVLDKAGHVGGRAITNVRDGIHFNLGPHALYCHGHAFRLLKELGVPFSGRSPNAGAGYFSDDKRLFPIPAGLRTLVTSRLLTVREKFRLVRILQSLPKLDTHPFDGVPLSDWIAQTAGNGNLAAMLHTLFRVATYAADHEHLSAGAALEQFQITLAGNVWYLDGGWQTIINGLRHVAQRDGASIQTGASARHVSTGTKGVVVELADGTRLTGSAGILAVDPATACKLLQLSDDAPLFALERG